MKAAGLITEYNPFHNGHLYHLEQSKRASNADCIICVMSGNFIQRGEPALLNKWARTKMALCSGADLVLELPVVYAMASAEFFAYGAVKILESTGVTDFICFGSENGSIQELDKIADILVKEPVKYKRLLKLNLDKGLSFPKARELALIEYLYKDSIPAGDLELVISQPNNILGIEYLKALKKLGSSIIPITIKRIGSMYGSEKITGSISSATAIRKHIFDASLNMWGNLSEVIPENSLNIMKKEFDEGRAPIFPDSFGDVILACLRKMTAEEIKSLPYVSEGLENRIKESVNVSGSFNELVENICTRRYPRTRIKRILFHSLTGMTGEELDEFNSKGGPQYIRVLGFNEMGRQILSIMNDKASLPVIVKTANFKNTPNPLLDRMLEIESSATDMYVLGCSNTGFRHAGQEFTQNVIRYEVTPGIHE